MPRHHVLLDSNVIAAHYAPKSTKNATLATRATALLTGSSPDLEIKFLTPNFCIAEVFAVFEKYRWGHTWNKQVKKANTLTNAEFASARDGFRNAIHNGAKILQADLNRYHVLCADLISPINNAYKINRVRGGAVAKEKAKRTVPAKTFDMLFVAMGIWLSNQLGRNNLTLVTADQRICDVVIRAQSTGLSKAIQDHLTAIATGLGLTYSADIYPEALDLAHATKAELRAQFPTWAPAW